MHDCRLGFPAIATWIASQHEQRREQVTPIPSRLSKQEQEERRKMDVPPSAAVPLLPERAGAAKSGAVEWVKWNGGTRGCPLPAGTHFMVEFDGGLISATQVAPAFRWNRFGNATDIVAYRVVVPQ